jgi:uncharacterized protein YeaO (DUF488 family)
MDFRRDLVDRRHDGMSIRLKRAYVAPAPDDGLRILVDRLWPRGLTKDRAHVDVWLKEIAPSAALRKWFGHDRAKWAEFRRRYLAELDANPAAVAELRRQIAGRDATLLYGAKDEAHNQARVLSDFLVGAR